VLSATENTFGVVPHCTCHKDTLARAATSLHAGKGQVYTGVEQRKE
jgi:hypothetical protein